VSEFRIQSEFRPTGHQPEAIEGLSAGVRAGATDQTLLGVTGSGKTFTMACIVEEVQRPTLVMAPNKTLAAQLFTEFRELFPDNAVEYFVSYYDYYQPEAYLPATDVYIEKDASINERIDRMRHSATRSVLSRRDVIVVASVSCIYGLGSPDAYLDMRVELERGQILERDELLRQLTAIQYRRRDFDLGRGTFRVRGDVIDLFPIYEDDACIRFELFGDEIETIQEIDPLTGEIRKDLDTVRIYPATHYVTPEDRLEQAVGGIEVELEERLNELARADKRLEAGRELFSVDGISRLDLELREQEAFSARLEFDRARAELIDHGIPETTLQRVLESREPDPHLPLAAPIDGVVLDLAVQQHEWVQEYEPLLVIGDPQRIELELQIDPDRAADVAAGDTVEFVPVGRPSTTGRASVVTQVPQVDPSTRTIRIRARITRSDFTLYPGVFVEGTLTHGAVRQAPSIPSSSARARTATTSRPCSSSPDRGPPCLQNAPSASGRQLSRPGN